MLAQKRQPVGPIALALDGPTGTPVVSGWNGDADGGSHDDTAVGSERAASLRVGKVPMS